MSALRAVPGQWPWTWSESLRPLQAFGPGCPGVSREHGGAGRSGWRCQLAGGVTTSIRVCLGPPSRTCPEAQRLLVSRCSGAAGGGAGQHVAASSTLGARCSPRPGGAPVWHPAAVGVSVRSPCFSDHFSETPEWPVTCSSVSLDNGFLMHLSPPRSDVRVAGSACAGMGVHRATPPRTFPARTLDEAASGLVGPQSPASVFPN